jgi:ATP dependent DNA ligase domain
MSRFAGLGDRIAASLGVGNAILDGEIIATDETGRPRFYDLLRDRWTPTYVAFDLIWLNGADLRPLPLAERRRYLQNILPKGVATISGPLSVTGTGQKLFELTCAHDLEGMGRQARTVRPAPPPLACPDGRKRSRPTVSVWHRHLERASSRSCGATTTGRVRFEGRRSTSANRFRDRVWPVFWRIGPVWQTTDAWGPRATAVGAGLRSLAGQGVPGRWLVGHPRAVGPFRRGDPGHTRENLVAWNVACIGMEATVGGGMHRHGR